MILLTRPIKKVNKELEREYKDTYKDYLLDVSGFDKIIVTTFEKLFSISDKIKTKFSGKPLDENALADISVMAAGNAAAASSELSDNGYLRGEFTSKLVTEFMNAVTIKTEGSYPQLYQAKFNEKTFCKVELLKTICFQSVVASPRLKMAEQRGFNIIDTIFDTLTIEKEGRRLLPEDWADVYFGFTSDEMRRRTVCDFIASMTDRYCIEFYSRIVGLNPPSIQKLF